MGEFKFSLLTTMPILDGIFLISIQKIAYILENGGWGAGYHVAREYNLSGGVYVGGEAGHSRTLNKCKNSG